MKISDPESLSDESEADGDATVAVKTVKFVP